MTPYPPLPTIDPLLKVTTGYYRLLTVIKIMVLIMR